MQKKCDKQICWLIYIVSFFILTGGNKKYNKSIRTMSKEVFKLFQLLIRYMYATYIKWILVYMQIQKSSSG